MFVRVGNLSAWIWQFSCLCIYELASPQYIWLLSNVLMHHTSDSPLWHLTFFGDDLHWFFRIIINYILNSLDGLQCPYSIWMFRMFFFLLDTIEIFPPMAFSSIQNCVKKILPNLDSWQHLKLLCSPHMAIMTACLFIPCSGILSAMGYLKRNKDNWFGESNILIIKSPQISLTPYMCVCI